VTARAFAVLVVLGIAVVASAVAVVDARQENRRLFVSLTQLEAQRDELDIEFGQLQLEQATWADTARVEQVARGDLGLVFPTPVETRILRR